MKQSTILAVVAAFSMHTSLQIGAEPNHLGINLSPISEYDPVKLFVDAIKCSRGFCKSSDANTPASLDAQGWPTEDCQVVIFAQPFVSQGTYALYFTTQNPSVNAGTVNVTFDWAKTSVVSTTYNAGTNTVKEIVTILDSASNVLLRFSNTQGGVKNVKLMRHTAPGGTTTFDTSVTFYPPAKTFFGKFKVLRFMQVVNAMSSNMVADWADRTPRNWAIQSSRYYQGGYTGVAWEYLIQLCNETNCDMWVNIPFLCTDDYVKQLAALLKAQLNPNLKIYVEYANEVWNFAGYDGGRNHDSAMAEVARGGSPLNFDGITNTYQWGWRRVAKRASEISADFRSVFGDSAMMTRVRPMLMTQQNNGQGTLDQCLYLMEYYYNDPSHAASPHPPKYYFWGAGGAPYYDPDPSATVDNCWTSAEFNTTTFANVELTSDAVRAATFGLKRCSYEGGPEMAYLSNEAAKCQIWADPRLTGVLLSHHDAWSNYGGDLFTYFTTANYGSTDCGWSFVHAIEDLNTPKVAAIDSLNNRPRAPVTLGKSLPAAFGGMECSYQLPGYGPAPQNAPLTYKNGLLAGYIFNTAMGGHCGVTLTVSGSGTLRVCIDGDSVGVVQVSAATTTPQLIGIVDAGLHSVTLKAFGDSVTVTSLSVSQIDVVRTLPQKSGLTNRNVCRIYGTTGGRVVINGLAQTAGPVRIEVTDLTGRCLRSVSTQAGVSRCFIDMRATAPRIVIVTVHSGPGITAQRLVMTP